MADQESSFRGNRDSSWLVLQRGLAITRRLMRGPAAKADLLAAVRFVVGPDAYSEQTQAAELALKHDRTALRQHLGVEITFDRRAGVYRLESLGDTAWLDLEDDDLAAVAVIYETFARGGPEAQRVEAFLDKIAGLLPPGRLDAIRRLRSPLTIELRELDEGPIPGRVMEMLQRAVVERRRLSMNYIAAAQEDQQPRYHEVEPYGLVFRQGHYYLECFDLFSRADQQERVTHNAHRRLRLSAIVNDAMLTVLPDRLPPGRRPQGDYAVRYRLAAPAVRNGVSRHFADMQVERLAEGSAVISATTHDPWDAARTLLHYGDSCTVLGGDEVLREMRKIVAAMAKNYDLIVFEAP